MAKRGPKLGPNRRHTHAAAVEVALAHLAQVAGFVDATRLEWECEARLAPPGTGSWAVGDYALTVTADASLNLAKADKPLRSVPAAVRSAPEYAQARARQEALRSQSRRMRTGLVERLVATAGTLTPDELTMLRTLPAGASMLPALLWHDAHDHIGLLDDVDTSAPVTAVHPFLLWERELLSHWQAEIFQRRIRQPVKQAFRELCLLTPAERDDGFVSRRFAGHTVVGKVAAQLLSSRGWRTDHQYSDVQAHRPSGPFTACLSGELHGYWGMSNVALGGVWFVRTGGFRWCSPRFCCSPTTTRSPTSQS